MLKLNARLFHLRWGVYIMSTIEERRIEFHNKLLLTLSQINPIISVYFSAPTNLSLRYPAAIYKRDGMDRKNANDRVYLKRCKYTLTIVDDAPNESYIDHILDSFEYASFDRQYVVDSLNHYVFTIFF